MELIPVSLPNYIVPYLGTSTLRSRHLDRLSYVYAADKRIPTTSPFLNPISIGLLTFGTVFLLILEKYSP